MADRYYIDRTLSFDPDGSSRATLVGGEAHHLIHVMRVGVGADVVLFDGSGAEFPSRVERVGRAEVELAVLQRREIDRELPWRVALAVALPKGERQRWLVEKAVELGVAELIPLTTFRSVAQPVQQALDRLRRAVVEASKQCGRNRLMQISEPADWPDFIMATRNEPQRLLAHPEGPDSKSPDGPPGQSRAAQSATGGHGSSFGFPKSAIRILAAVGPEGGLAAEEVAVARAAGWKLVDLGPRVLRTETAALAMAALAAAYCSVR
ncbi:MAG: 16S rRNA (uracil(1498)-N(3))-methyltransferase [Thermoguttaceae bacterium]|nr:16S rRNA (uracil(1498)-N(3))-methyltransferase [Thermoguttaceae bacterium]